MEYLWWLLLLLLSDRPYPFKKIYKKRMQTKTSWLNIDLILIYLLLASLQLLFFFLTKFQFSYSPFISKLMYLLYIPLTMPEGELVNDRSNIKTISWYSKIKSTVLVKIIAFNKNTILFQTLGKFFCTRALTEPHVKIYIYLEAFP